MRFAERSPTENRNPLSDLMASCCANCFLYTTKCLKKKKKEEKKRKVEINQQLVSLREWTDRVRWMGELPRDVSKEQRVGDHRLRLVVELQGGCGRRPFAVSFAVELQKQRRILRMSCAMLLKHLG